MHSYDLHDVYKYLVNDIYLQLSKLVLYVNKVTLPVTSSYTTHRLYGINRKPIHEIRLLEVCNKITI